MAFPGSAAAFKAVVFFAVWVVGQPTGRQLGSSDAMFVNYYQELQIKCVRYSQTQEHSRAPFVCQPLAEDLQT